MAEVLDETSDPRLALITRVLDEAKECKGKIVTDWQDKGLSVTVSELSGDHAEGIRGLLDALSMTVEVICGPQETTDGPDMIAVRFLIPGYVAATHAQVGTYTTNHCRGPLCTANWAGHTRLKKVERLERLRAAPRVVREDGRVVSLVESAIPAVEIGKPRPVRFLAEGYDVRANPSGPWLTVVECVRSNTFAPTRLTLSDGTVLNRRASFELMSRTPAERERAIEYEKTRVREVVHGSPKTYGNWGCDCTLCTAAWKEEGRVLKQNRKTRADLAASVAASVEMAVAE